VELLQYDDSGSVNATYNLTSPVDQWVGADNMTYVSCEVLTALRALAYCYYDYYYWAKSLLQSKLFHLVLLISPYRGLSVVCLSHSCRLAD